MSKLPKTALFWPKFPGISGNFGISGKFPPDFPPDFPRISPRGTPVSRADPRKNRGNFPPKFRGFSGGFPGVFREGFMASLRIFWGFPGFFHGFYEGFPWLLQGFSEILLGSFPGSSSALPGLFLGNDYRSLIKLVIAYLCNIPN